MKSAITLITLSLALAAPLPAWAKLDLPLLFSDGAVLQRDQPMRVSGQADAGTSVEVGFDGQQARAVADKDGRWSATLPAHAAGGPFELVVQAGDERRVIRDVLVGDVWLASGQSNMEWPVSQAANAQAEIEAANDPLIRQFKIPKTWAGQPQVQLAGGAWKSASPQTVGEFTAVGYFFARELRARTGVPIGIVNSTWGGSSIEAWTDAASQGMDAKAIARQGKKREATDARARAVTEARLARWGKDTDDTHWQETEIDDREWDRIAVPGLWESSGYEGMDGVAWYRTRFTLTAAEAAAGVTLGVGRIDDTDVTWVNGQQVGETQMQYNHPRAYAVPPDALHAGVNQVAVRVSDFGGGGGIHGEADELFVQPQGAAKRAIDGEWKFHPAHVSVALEDGKNQLPALLYNAMIHPILPYALRGVIWYQGEANADTRAHALHYREQFASLINQWRQNWNSPALPFLWVQLANFKSGADTATDSPWAILRESQSAALDLPATAQALAIDIGNPANIHPLDKQSVGHRLALAARHVAYGETLVYRGPEFTKVHFEHGMGLLEFDLGGSALAVRGGGDALQGFELAGADRHFHAAKASISDGRVVVQSDAVPMPVAVRYGWSDNPERANLINHDDLPASPFRSDDW